MKKGAGPIIPEEQRRYASLLAWSVCAGLGVLLLSFIAYVLGWLPARTPFGQWTALWRLPLDEYLKQTQAPTGWHWLGQVGHGDFAVLVGIAVLAGSSLLCLLAVIPLYAKKRDRIFVGICLVAIFIQLLAASGWLSAGQ
jgi:hypothetical protein